MDNSPEIHCTEIFRLVEGVEAEVYIDLMISSITMTAGYYCSAM